MLDVKERVRAFNIVREIPYSISIGKEQDFSCSTKAEILKRMLGLPSRYMICEFRWEDLKLPKEVLVHPHEDPEYHLFLQARLQRKWINVDPTWDSRLRAVLPISDWNGLHGTKIAVPATRVFSPEESNKIIRKITSPKVMKEYISGMRGQLLSDL